MVRDSHLHKLCQKIIKWICFLLITLYDLYENFLHLIMLTEADKALFLQPNGIVLLVKKRTDCLLAKVIWRWFIVVFLKRNKVKLIINKIYL